MVKEEIFLKVPNRQTWVMEEPVEIVEEEKEKSIQEIYEKAYDEEYDNILIRDMQMRIENRIEELIREYLEKLGLVYDYESETYNGEITASDWDIENDKIIENVKFKVNLKLKHPDVRIESNYPGFSCN